MIWWPWLYPKLIGNWPKGPGPLGRRNALFNRPAAPLRPMIVMVDGELFSRANQDPEVQYLFELLTVPPIQSHLYLENGPPKYAQTVIAPDSGVQGFKDWVVTVATHDDNIDAIYLKDGVPIRVATEVKDADFLHMPQTLPIPDRSREVHVRSVKADKRAMLVAKSIRADLFITDRHLIVDSGMDFWRGVSVMSPHAALPIIGLYLRQQEKYIFHKGPALGMPTGSAKEIQRDRTWFYWQASQTLIPARYRWASACEMYSNASDDTTLSSLPKALTWRLNQVLRARDRLLTTLAVVPQNHAPADEAMTELDQILLWLMAALDITAQVAHVSLEKFL